MRVLIDTNIFISYLGRSRNQGTIFRLVEATFLSPFTLLVPEALLEELRKTAIAKVDVAKRITVKEAELVFTVIQEVAEVIPTITEPLPEISRDKKDNYLLSYAAVGKADYLVSGDGDLLDVGQYAGVKIVSPAQFLVLLEEEVVLA